MLFARFWQNRDGGVAPFLAIAALPLIGFTGAGIDYARTNAARTAMQSALDSTALSLQDGSGMSHQNLITPAAVVRLLDYARTAFAERGIDEQVRKNPWAAIAIAAGVGLVIGVLLSRK